MAIYVPHPRRSHLSLSGRDTGATRRAGPNSGNAIAARTALAERARSSHPGYVLRLADVTSADAWLVGAKAASLGDLSSAGFPIPDGIVVSTRAFERFLTANRLEADATESEVAAAPLPPDLESELRLSVRPFGDAPLAVRSSGAAEDLPGASFAGQYQTFLDVRGEERVLDAVRRCWASAFSPNVAAYLATRNGGSSGAMAVIVQRLVMADRAGIAFSANPVDGDRSIVVVNASWGLGEAIVSGLVDPDVYVISKGDLRIVARQITDKRVMTASLAEGGTEERPVPFGRRRIASLGDEEVRELAQVTAGLEAKHGRPVDVEFAFVGPRLSILQCRPITTL